MWHKSKSKAPDNTSDDMKDIDTAIQTTIDECIATLEQLQAEGCDLPTAIKKLKEMNKR
jgi:hypothetical protein